MENISLKLSIDIDSIDINYIIDLRISTMYTDKMFKSRKKDTQKNNIIQQKENIFNCFSIDDDDI